MERPDDPSGKAFEDMCLIIYGKFFLTTDARFQGRRGQGQHGIDIRLTDRTCSRPGGRQVVIQCKNYRKELRFRDVENDLLAAYRNRDAFGRFDEFIIATTSEADGKLDAAVERFTQQHHLPFNVLIHNWDKIESIVNSHPDLCSYFLPSLYAESAPSYASTQTAREIDELVSRGQLKQAQTVLGQHVREHSPKQAIMPANVQADLRRSWLSLCMAAGDFLQAAPILDRELPCARFDAGLRLEYVRTRRVLSQLTRLDVGYSLVGETRKTFPQEVDQEAAQLLSARGTLDEQLTLAYFVILYSGTEDIIDNGLCRAVSLLLQSEATWDGPGARDRTIAYSCIQAAYVARRGPDRCREIEDAQSDSARRLSQQADQFGLDLTLIWQFIHLNEKVLPLLKGELRRGRWEREKWVEIEPAKRALALPERRACSSDALILDCLLYNSANRRKQYKLYAPTLSIERLLCFYRTIELAVEIGHFPGSEAISQPHKLLPQLQELIAACGLGRRYQSVPPDMVSAEPSYFDHETPRITEAQHAIQLALSKGAPFLTAELMELHRFIKARECPGPARFVTLGPPGKLDFDCSWPNQYTRRPLRDIR